MHLFFLKSFRAVFARFESKSSLFENFFSHFFSLSISFIINLAKIFCSISGSLDIFSKALFMCDCVSYSLPHGDAHLCVYEQLQTVSSIYSTI